MKRVTSLGGIFIKCQDPKKIREWYRDHLGLTGTDYETFEWRYADEPNKKGSTLWSTFKENTDYFEPSKKEFMINFRVENLEELLKLLKAEGIEQLGEMQVYDFGKFAHIMDPEGTKIELWEAIDEE